MQRYHVRSTVENGNNQWRRLLASVMMRICKGVSATHAIAMAGRTTLKALRKNMHVYKNLPASKKIYNEISGSWDGNMLIDYWLWSD